MYAPFIAVGSELAQTGKIDKLLTVDLAPSIMRALGYDIPDEMVGKPIF